PNAPSAFDSGAFLPPSARGAASNAELRGLGETLFFDANLSESRRVSCASCHQPDRAFADGVALSTGAHGRPAARNTPTLVNAALQTELFSDGRTAFLEDQAREVITNATEM